MDMTFTLQDLGLFLIFFFGIAACVCVIILVLNLNKIVVDFRELINKNKNNLDETLQDLPKISKNLVEIEDTVKNDLVVLEPTIKKLSGVSGGLASTANVTTAGGDIIVTIKSIIEVVEFLIGLILGKKQDKKDAKKAKEDKAKQKDEAESKNVVETNEETVTDIENEATKMNNEEKKNKKAKKEKKKK